MITPRLASRLAPLWNEFRYMEHQEVGVNWMLEKESAGSGGLLCDEMGLGKTIQMVGLIKNQVKTRRQATLLIAPVAVLGQWKSVLKRSNIRVWVPRTGKAPFIPSWSSPPNTPAAKNPRPYFWQMESNSKDLLAHSVYVIGYEAAQRSPSILKDVAWDRVIYDEAHRLGSNNQSTELALSFTEKLKVKNIWLLTGTPIVNKVSDLRNLFVVAGIEAPKTNELKLLEPIIKKYVMARTMDQLRDQIADAPPKPTFKTFSLEFSTEEEGDFYKGMTGIICKRWKALDADGSGPTGMEKLKLFMRLRQLSLHPQIYIAARKNALKKLYTRADWNGSSTKFDKLQEIICESPTSHKWIIFTHFHEEMNMLENMFRVENNIELVQQYHGGLTAAQKADVIERSHMPIAPGKQEVLLVQLQSGGTGINLQHFDRIIFTGPWWTKALMEQAVGRAVRIGQKNEVQVISLSLKEEEALNIDKYMLDKAAEKGELCRGVLASANTAINKVKEENAISV
jgi:SNF2 family DNA or RNA helicase